MSSISSKVLATAAALSFAAVTMAAPAEAGRYHHRHHHHHHGSAGAAAIIGLGVGAIIGSALTSPSYYAPPAYYAPPPPPPYAYKTRYAPPRGTPDWEAYCFSKYPDFDPYSGTFRGPDGRRYYCR